MKEGWCLQSTAPFLTIINIPTQTHYLPSTRMKRSSLPFHTHLLGTWVFCNKFTDIIHKVSPQLHKQIQLHICFLPKLSQRAKTRSGQVFFCSFQLQLSYQCETNLQKSWAEIQDWTESKLLQNSPPVLLLLFSAILVHKNKEKCFLNSILTESQCWNCDPTETRLSRQPLLLEHWGKLSKQKTAVCGVRGNKQTGSTLHKLCEPLEPWSHHFLLKNTYHS